MYYYLYLPYISFLNDDSKKLYIEFHSGCIQALDEHNLFCYTPMNS